MGSSHQRGKSDSNLGGPNSNLRSGGVVSSSTSRPNPKRQHYHGFESDDEYRMQTLVEGGVPVDKSANWRNRDGDSDKDRDDNSAKAIIQTRTLQIEYEDRNV